MKSFLRIALLIALAATASPAASMNTIESIRFFDSISPLWPLSATADALAVIRKRGRHPVLRHPG